MVIFSQCKCVPIPFCFYTSIMREIAEFFCLQLKFAFEKKKNAMKVLYGLFCLLAFAALTAEGSDISVLGAVFG